jgi:hypothetical protein
LHNTDLKLCYPGCNQWSCMSRCWVTHTITAWARLLIVALVLMSTSSAVSLGTSKLRWPHWWAPCRGWLCGRAIHLPLPRCTHSHPGVRLRRACACTPEKRRSREDNSAGHVTVGAPLPCQPAAAVHPHHEHLPTDQGRSNCQPSTTETLPAQLPCRASWRPLTGSCATPAALKFAASVGRGG